jgi:hypothetical protein
MNNLRSFALTNIETGSAELMMPFVCRTEAAAPDVVLSAPFDGLVAMRSPTPSFAVVVSPSVRPGIATTAELAAGFEEAISAARGSRATVAATGRGITSCSNPAKRSVRLRRVLALYKAWEATPTAGPAQPAHAHLLYDEPSRTGNESHIC